MNLTWSPAQDKDTEFRINDNLKFQIKYFITFYTHHILQNGVTYLCCYKQTRYNPHLLAISYDRKNTNPVKEPFTVDALLTVPELGNLRG